MSLVYAIMKIVQNVKTMKKLQIFENFSENYEVLSKGLKMFRENLFKKVDNVRNLHLEWVRGRSPAPPPAEAR